MMSNVSRRHLFALLAGAAMPASLSLAAPVMAANDAGPKFRRGASIHNLLNWASLSPNDKQTYNWPPFATKNHTLANAIYDNMLKAGFDYIRLTVDPGPFMQFTGSQRDELDQLLLKTVNDLKTRGFGVVVDFHPNWQVATYAPEKITAAVGSPLMLGYGAMLARTARLLAPMAKDRVALELMNEPQWGWDGGTTQRWQQILLAWHDQVRAVSKDLTLILSGARGGDRQGLMNLDMAPFRNSNVLWSFHYYEPFLLTHQGVKNDEGAGKVWRYFSDLPYPASPDLMDIAWKGIQRNIDKDKTLDAGARKTMITESKKALTDYLAKQPGRKTISADFREIAAWAKKNDIATSRIFLGEFGITRTYSYYNASNPQTLEFWLSDVRQEAESLGFGWCFWLVTGYGGMSLIENDDSVTLDKPTLAGLGLKRS